MNSKDSLTSSIQESQDNNMSPALQGMLTKLLYEEKMRKLTKPTPSSEDIFKILKDFSKLMHKQQDIDANLEGYNEAVHEVDVIKELDSYEDYNCLVKIGNGKYLLKIHNGIDSKAYIDECADSTESPSFSSISLQNTIMNHLVANGIKTSEPVLDVSLYLLPVLSSEHSPQRLAVRLLTWIDGTTMSTCSDLSIESVLEAGRLLGKINVSLDKMIDELQQKQTKERSHPIFSDRSALMRVHTWDIKNTEIVSYYIKYIKDADMRVLVEDVIKGFRKDILPQQKKFHTGCVHNDFNGTI